MKRIHVLCQVYYPDSQATSLLFTPLLETLAARGWDITVYCGFPAESAGGVPCPRSERRNGVSIIRCGVSVRTKANLFFRAVAYACFLAEAFLRMLLSRPANLNFGVTNPPFNAVLLWWLRLIKGTPFVYMLLDVHPDGMVALGALKREQATVRVWKWLNARSYAAAERLVVLGRDMVELLRVEYDIEASRCVYIPHWSALAVQPPVPFEESRLIEYSGLSGKFVVQYSGNMGLWHDIEGLVRAASLLVGHPHIHFVFIGGGIRRAKAKALSDQLALANVSWRNFVPLDHLSDSLAACHVALLSLGEGLEGVAVPSKLYGILASGRAVLAQVPVRSEVAMTIADHDCGVVVPNGDPGALAEAILTLSSNLGRTMQMGRNAAKSYESHFTIHAAVEKFHAVWQESCLGSATETSMHSGFRDVY